MSKNPIRKEKDCLNCGEIVEQRYCPNCGQENIDPRKTFHHLFVHFFEDLTHYENSFWKTIKNLILKPGELTKQYLSGKRMSYLAPIRLYIFISFVTFLVIALTKDSIIEYGQKNDEEKTTKTEKIMPKAKEKASSNKEEAQDNEDDDEFVKFNPNNQEKDIIKVDYGKDEKVPSIIKDFIDRIKEIQRKNTNKEIFEKVSEAFLHNMPKAIMIYMPIFAFFLWLFHNKKKWYYFDHGIFTLHYFSFLLVGFLIMSLLLKILGLVDQYEIFDFLSDVVAFVGFGYIFYYFLPAHHRFYGGSRIKNALFGSVFFIFNWFLMAIIFSGLVIYSFYTIH